MSPFVPRNPVRHTDRVLARGVLLVLLALFTLSFGGVANGPREEIDFQAISALGRTGDLALSGTPETERLFEWVRQRPGGSDLLTAGVGDRADKWYSTAGVAQTATGLPLYFIGRLLSLAAPGLEERHASAGHEGGPASEYLPHLVVGWRGSLLSALTACLVVLAARRLRVERPHAWFAGLAYGLSTFAWPQSSVGLDDVQGTFFLFMAFHLLLRIRARFSRLEHPSLVELVSLGVTLAWVVLTKDSLLPAVLVLCAATEVVLTRGYTILKETPWGASQGATRKGRGATVAVFTPLLLGGALFVWFHHLRTGALPTGLGGASSWSPQNLPAGIAGLLVSPGRGLIWMAPLVLLVPAGIVRTRRRGERLFERVLLGIFLAILLPAAGLRAWHGGWTYGPSLLLPALPFLWLAVALGLRVVQEVVMGRALVLFLFLFGVLTQLPGVLVPHTAHLDLAQQAALVRWPAEEGADEAEMEARRFERIQWDLAFAAPWAHWRILRHRVAGLEDTYDAKILYGVEGAGPLRTRIGSTEAFRHLVWVDVERRLGTAPWAWLLAIMGTLVAGMAMSRRGLDPAAP